MTDKKIKKAPDEASIREQLREVIDPEFGIDIVNLGLVYAIFVQNRNVEIQFTLTTPSCPLEEQFRREMTFQIGDTFDVNELTLKTVWFPRWDASFMSEEARFMAGLPI
jgi:metal-sulfur cluster biosynthetic enzyme